MMGKTAGFGNGDRLSGKGRDASYGTCYGHYVQYIAFLVKRKDIQFKFLLTDWCTRRDEGTGRYGLSLKV